jgi:hypothetical protein
MITTVNKNTLPTKMKSNSNSNFSLDSLSVIAVVTTLATTLYFLAGSLF